jgi:hypothetical protein
MGYCMRSAIYPGATMGQCRSVARSFAVTSGEGQMRFRSSCR